MDSFPSRVQAENRPIDFRGLRRWRQLRDDRGSIARLSPVVRQLNEPERYRWAGD